MKRCFPGIQNRPGKPGLMKAVDFGEAGGRDERPTTMGGAVVATRQGHVAGGEFQISNGGKSEEKAAVRWRRSRKQTCGMTGVESIGG